MSKANLAIAALTLSLLMSATAEATPLLFTFTDAAQTDSFILGSTATPNGGFIDPTAPPGAGPNPYFTNVAGTAADQAQDTFQYLTFYSQDDEGGVIASLNSPADLAGDAPEYFNFTGTQIYAGSAISPLFSTGSYSLVDASNDQNATLTISAAPEPSTWALLVAGVALSGGMLRLNRRSRNVTTAMAQFRRY